MPTFFIEADYQDGPDFRSAYAQINVIETNPTPKIVKADLLALYSQTAAATLIQSDMTNVNVLPNSVMGANGQYYTLLITGKQLASITALRLQWHNYGPPGTPLNKLDIGEVVPLGDLGIIPFYSQVRGGWGGEWYAIAWSIATDNNLFNYSQWYELQMLVNGVWLSTEIYFYTLPLAHV